MSIVSKAKSWWSKPDKIQTLYQFVVRHAPMVFSFSGLKQLNQSTRHDIALQFDREILTIMEKTDSESALVDVGSNVGKFMQPFLEKGYTVISVDPLPYVIEIQKRNYAPYLEANKLYLHNLACSSASGEATLFVSSDANGCFSSLEESWSQEIYSDMWNGDIATVNTAPLRTLIEQYWQNGINASVIKIDTEGHEFDVLQGLFDGLRVEMFPKLIMFEFHTQPGNKRVLTESLNLLRERGFKKFKYVIRYWDMVLFESDWLTETFDINQWDSRKGLVPPGYRTGNILAIRE